MVYLSYKKVLWYYLDSTPPTTLARTDNNKVKDMYLVWITEGYNP